MQTSAYAVSTWEYYASGSSIGKLSAEIDPLGKRTDYTYNSVGRLIKVKNPPDITNGTRAETNFTYDTAGNAKTITNAQGHVTEHFYDLMGRKIRTQFADGTSEKFIYGTTGDSAGLIVKSVDRMGVVTNNTYDAADRLISRVRAAAIMDVNGSESATAAGVTSTETFAYVNGSDLRIFYDSTT